MVHLCQYLAANTLCHSEMESSAVGRYRPQTVTLKKCCSDGRFWVVKEGGRGLIGRTCRVAPLNCGFVRGPSVRTVASWGVCQCFLEDSGGKMGAAPHLSVIPVNIASCFSNNRASGNKKDVAQLIGSIRTPELFSAK